MNDRKEVLMQGDLGSVIKSLDQLDLTESAYRDVKEAVDTLFYLIESIEDGTYHEIGEAS